MTKMRIIDVPMTYTVKYIPYKMRKAVPFEIIENIPVDIPDLSPAEAPVAMRFKPLNSYWSGEGPMDHLWFGERLYSPFGRAASGKQSVVLGVHEMVKMMEEKTEYYVPFNVPPRLLNGKQYIDIKDLPVGKMYDNGVTERDQKAAEIRKYAANMIFVGGKVYLACEEPIYRLVVNSYGFRRRDMEEALFHLETIRSSDITLHDTPDAHYRVDRLDEAVAYMRSREEYLGKVPPEDISEWIWNKVEVKLPEAVRFVFNVRPRMDMVVDRLFASLKDHLPDAQLPLMEAYVAFRALRDEAPRDYDKVATFLAEELIPAMRAEKMSSPAKSAECAVAEWMSRAEPAALSAKELAAMVV